MNSTNTRLLLKYSTNLAPLSPDFYLITTTALHRQKHMGVCIHVLNAACTFSIDQKLIFRRYCIQNFQDGIQIQVYNIDNKSINHFIQFISVKVKKKLRKPQAQFRKKLRKLRLRQNYGFLIKKLCAVKNSQKKQYIAWAAPHTFSESRYSQLIAISKFIIKKSMLSIRGIHS